MYCIHTGASLTGEHLVLGDNICALLCWVSTFKLSDKRLNSNWPGSQGLRKERKAKVQHEGPEGRSAVVTGKAAHAGVSI